MTGFDAALPPTLMQMPPTIDETETDFDRLNAAMLRNTSLVNLVDGCALAMPTPGSHPLWSMTMLIGCKGADAVILSVAERLQVRPPSLPHFPLTHISRRAGDSAPAIAGRKCPVFPIQRDTL